MACQICDLEPTDLGAAIRLLEEIRQLPDSTPIDIDQFITEVNDGAVVVVALAERCIGFTPGDVDLAAQRAASLAFSRARDGGDATVTAADLAAAVERTSPSVTREMYDTFRSEVATFERI